MLSTFKRPRASAVTAIFAATVLLALTGCGTASSSSTPEPTATSTPQPTPTPRADGLSVTHVDFGDPVEGTVFEELLARFPDDEDSRHVIHLFDPEGIQAALGLDAPEPGAGANAPVEFLDSINSLEGNHLTRVPGLFPFWPWEMRPYMEEINWYPDVAFDMWSAEQYANNQTASFLGLGPDSQRSYQVAFGKFDPAATEAALAACGCDQPDLNEYGGFTYYSWGEDFAQDLRNRLGRPLYDHLGRGPRLLVSEGEAFWTVSDDTMELYIDVLNGTQPSLANDADYMAAIRWLATMGTMSDMSIASRGLSIDSIPDIEGIGGAILAAPLLQRFSAYAAGTGHDGERIFDALVLVHDDEATAQANVSLLLDRISAHHDRDFPEVEIEVEGRFLLVRAYTSPDTGGNLVNPVLHLLLIHE